MTSAQAAPYPSIGVSPVLREGSADELGTPDFIRSVLGVPSSTQVTRWRPISTAGVGVELNRAPLSHLAADLISA